MIPCLDKKPNIPALTDPELTFETITVDRSPVLIRGSAARA